MARKSTPWLVEEVTTFLHYIADEKIQRELDGTTRNIKVFQEVSTQMSTSGYSRTVVQCREKLKKMKSEYRLVKDNNNTSGASRKNWKWFELMDTIYGHRPASVGRDGGLDSATALLESLHDVTEAMQVTTSGPQTIQKALGETVTLGCTYTLGPEDTGVLDIEWSNVSPDMTQKDQLLLSYTGGLTMRYGDPSVNKRLKFIVDPKQGDASVSLSNLVLKDTATYQCKVKKAPGVDMRKVTLNVMVPPTSPKCWVEGPEEKGGPVSLLCKSYQGSIPLSYTWRRESGGAIPADAIQNLETGELLIKNHTDGNIGSYTCEVKNAVGKGQCKYALHAYNPTNKVGIIVGAVIGALLLLLLLLLLIWLLVCCCNKRRYEKEVENEIREDAPAPESRPTSRPTSRNSSIHSSLRSVMAYRTHPGVQYSSVRKQLPSVSESAHGGVYTGESNGRSQPNTAGGRASLNYDNRFGYPV